MSERGSDVDDVELSALSSSIDNDFANKKSEDDLQLTTFTADQIETNANEEEVVQELEQMQEIHRTFSKVLEDMKGDTSVDQLLVEYKKMYEALKDSHRLQKKYMLDCSFLRCEIKNNAEKVHLAIHLSHEDKEIINNLTKQVNQAWSEVDNLIEKENKSRSLIKKLQTEISTMTALVEAGSGIVELQTVAEQAILERKELENALSALKEEMEFKDVKIQEASGKLALKEAHLNKEILKLKDRLSASENGKKEVQQKFDDMEEYCKALERRRTSLTIEYKNLLVEVENFKTKQARMEKEETDNKSEISKYTLLCNEQQESLSDKAKEISRLYIETDALKKRVKALQTTADTQKDNIEEKENDLGMCHRSMRRKVTEIESLAKRIEQSGAKFKMLTKQITDREEDLKNEKEAVIILRSSLNDMESKMNSVNKEVLALKRLICSEQANILKLTGQKKQLESNLSIKLKVHQILVRDVHAMNQHIAKAIRTVHQLESDKSQLNRRINQILELVSDLASDNDIKMCKIMALLKMASQQDSQIHTISSKLVHMTNQRDNMSNALHLVQLKNDELLTANVNYSKQGASLAEDLHTKETEIGTLMKNNSNLKSIISSLHNDIGGLKEENDRQVQKINETDAAVKHMDRILCKKESKIEEMNGTIDQLVTQRNLLGYQCSKKMEHIKMVTEKNKVMQNIFNLGNRAYQEQNRMIQLNKLQILDLFRQKSYLMKRIENNDNLRSKLGLANQQLVQSMAKVRAMEGEHPYNLHRWRHLKAVDVSQYEMVIKIQHLLKRIIVKTEEVTKLEGIVIDKTTVVSEMKQILERRVGPDIIIKAKATEKDKEALAKKLKAMTAERNMCMWRSDRQVMHNRHMITRVIEEQKKVSELKKNNMQLKSKVSKLPSIKDCSNSSKLQSV